MNSNSRHVTRETIVTALAALLAQSSQGTNQRDESDPTYDRPVRPVSQCYRTTDGKVWDSRISALLFQEALDEMEPAIKSYWEANGWPMDNTEYNNFRTQTAGLWVFINRGVIL